MAWNKAWVSTRQCHTWLRSSSFDPVLLFPWKWCFGRAEAGYGATAVDFWEPCSHAFEASRSAVDSVAEEECSLCVNCCDLLFLLCLLEAPQTHGLRYTKFCHGRLTKISYIERGAKSSTNLCKQLGSYRLDELLQVVIVYRGLAFASVLVSSMCHIKQSVSSCYEKQLVLTCDKWCFVILFNAVLTSCTILFQSSHKVNNCRSVWHVLFRRLLWVSLHTLLSCLFSRGTCLHTQSLTYSHAVIPQSGLFLVVSNCRSAWPLLPRWWLWVSLHTLLLCLFLIGTAYLHMFLETALLLDCFSTVHCYALVGFS